MYVTISQNKNLYALYPYAYLSLLYFTYTLVPNFNLFHKFSVHISLNFVL